MGGIGSRGDAETRRTGGGESVDDAVETFSTRGAYEIDE